jgi:hypothetical protein
MDVNDMDSIDDVVSSTQESGFTKITMVTHDTSREPSARTDVNAASEAVMNTEPQYERAAVYTRYYELVYAQLKKTFTDNTFGHACVVCDRLWFKTDLKKTIDKQFEFLRRHFPDEDVTAFELCATCRKGKTNGTLPTLSNSSK